MDPLEDYLKRSPLTQSQRADLWDAYHNASDQNALTAALKPLQIPNEVKAGLWDMKGTAKPQAPPSPVSSPPADRGIMGGVMDFAGGVWDTTAQPTIDLAKRVYEHGTSPEAYRNGPILQPVTSAWDTLSELYFGASKGSEEQFKAAFDMQQGKSYKDMNPQERMEVDARLAAGFLPMVGPAAAKAGEKLGTPGQQARGAGEATGLVASVLAPSVAKKVAPMVPKAIKGGVEAVRNFSEAHPMVKETLLHAIPVYGKARATNQIVQALDALRRGGSEARPLEAPAPVPTLEKPPVFPASMTRAEIEAETTRLIKAGKPMESRMLIEAMRAGDIKLVENPASVAPPSAPQAPRRAVPIPDPGKVKMATIHQPEGSFTMNTAEGRAAEAASKLTPENVALAEKQQGLIGAETDNPLIDPRAKPAPGKTAPIPDRGKAAVQAHGELRSFAKDYGKTHPEVDQIYVELDAQGKPVKVFESKYAGAMTKKGVKWTWVNNVWGDPKNLHSVRN